jgi:hypothetical protein
MCAAGVVSNHAAQSAAVVTRGIGRESQVMFLGGIAKMVEHNTRLHPSDAAGWVNLKDIRHVLGKIQDDGDVAALAGKGRTSAPAQKRRFEFAAQRNCGENVIGIAGENDSDGDLAIIRSVGGVERAGSVIEADIASNLRSQRFSQPSGIGSGVESLSSERGICRAFWHGAALI